VRSSPLVDDPPATGPCRCGALGPLVIEQPAVYVCRDCADLLPVDAVRFLTSVPVL
jgi:hypothetical protein